jgi:hypothetical protein
MVGFIVYFDVRCKCPVCVLLDDIVFMVVAVLCMWLSYVYCHLICMCGLVMCSCCTDCIDVLFRCRAAG